MHNNGMKSKNSLCSTVQYDLYHQCVSVC